MNWMWEIPGTSGNFYHGARDFEVIRKAISCDVCASEKRQTNHWFVAYEQAGELRVSGWNSRHRLRPGSKHLCGQTCLHKLVDEFIAKSIAVRTQRQADEEEPETAPRVDASLTSQAAHTGPRSPRTVLGPLGEEPAPPQTAVVPRERSLPSAEEPESSAHLLTSLPPVLPKPAHRPQPELVTMPPRPHPGEFAPSPAETPRYSSRNWRAEAWERERERELHAAENRSGIAARRRSSA